MNSGKGCSKCERGTTWKCPFKGFEHQSNHDVDDVMMMFMMVMVMPMMIIEEEQKMLMSRLDRNINLCCD